MEPTPISKPLIPSTQSTPAPITKVVTIIPKNLFFTKAVGIVFSLVAVSFIQSSSQIKKMWSCQCWDSDSIIEIGTILLSVGLGGAGAKARYDRDPADTYTPDWLVGRNKSDIQPDASPDQGVSAAPISADATPTGEAGE